MIKTHVPLSYYREVFASITYFIDQVSSSSINFWTPFKALTIEIYASTLLNIPPYILFCVAFVHLQKHHHNKLTPQALQCVFLWHANHQKEHRFYHPPA
jgi:hypothetical protein